MFDVGSPTRTLFQPLNNSSPALREIKYLMDLVRERHHGNTPIGWHLRYKFIHDLSCNLPFPVICFSGHAAAHIQNDHDPAWSYVVLSVGYESRVTVYSYAEVTFGQITYDISV